MTRASASQAGRSGSGSRRNGLVDNRDLLAEEWVTMSSVLLTTASLDSPETRKLLPTEADSSVAEGKARDKENMPTRERRCPTARVAAGGDVSATCWPPADRFVRNDGRDRI